MVVPTMLARIVDAVGEGTADVPTLRSLSYGGAKVSERVLFEALDKFPTTGFVNAYGLTETASTIAVLGPEDHRAAVESDDPEVRRRISSAGQVLPMVEIELRDELDHPVPQGETGLIFLRGEQISGEYASGSLLDAARLVLHEGSRLDRLRRLPVHRGPRRRHDHPRRREHRPGRDRRGVARPSGGRRGVRGRSARRRVGPAHRRRRRAAPGSRGRCRRAAREGAGRAARLEDSRRRSCSAISCRTPRRARCCAVSCCRSWRRTDA